MVLKSTKGIYMQLESGKIIAIRSTAKPGPDTNQNSSGSSGGVEQAIQSLENANKNQSNAKADSDDDECVMTSITYPTHKAPPPPAATNANFNLPSTSATNNIPQVPSAMQQQQEQVREKPVFKPNLVQRKPRGASITPPDQTFGSHQSHATANTANGGSQYNYNQHYTNYERPSPHNPAAVASNTTFSHANAQNFSNYQRKFSEFREKRASYGLIFIRSSFVKSKNFFHYRFKASRRPTHYPS